MYQEAQNIQVVERPFQGDFAWSGGRTRTVEEHEILFYRGDAAIWMYEVVDGVLVSYTYLANGRRQILSFSYPGDIVGLGHRTTCGCYCEALSDVRVRQISVVSLERDGQ